MKTNYFINKKLSIYSITWIYGVLHSFPAGHIKIVLTMIGMAFMEVAQRSAMLLLRPQKTNQYKDYFGSLQKETGADFHRCRKLQFKLYDNPIPLKAIAIHQDMPAGEMIPTM